MSFMLINYAPSRLEIGSDGGHHFAFEVLRLKGGRMIVMSDARWSGCQPEDAPLVLTDAFRFASDCAQDYGLM